MPWFKPGPLLIPQMLAANGHWLAEKPALLVGSEVYSWHEFSTACAQFANALGEAGLVPGERVGVVMDNAAETAIALFGAVYGGFVAVPINVSVTDAAIGTMLANSAVRAAVCNGQHAARLDPLREQIDSCELFVNVDPRTNWVDFAAFIASGVAGAPANVNATDECNIIYSSGTTGLPKGIVHDHRCRAAWAYDMAIALRYHPGARTLCSLGLYSNISWVAMLATILAGGTLTIMPRFDVAACLDLIERQRITHTAMVPVQLQRFLAQPELLRPTAIASLQSLMCCGSPLAPSVKEAVVATFGSAFLELYGLTEGLVTVLQPEDHATALHSVGKPCPGQELRILDGADLPCAAGVSGEIVGRGPLQMAGYHQRDDANNEATWIDEDGQRWLRTGDIGKLDESGFLYLVDRKKDMIISGGQNIYPADIEAVLIEHDAVNDVAVIGVASERWGETPLAVVVLGTSATTEDVRDWANSRLGKQQRLADVRRIDALPRNPNGKVLKRELREQFKTLTL